MAHGKYDTYIYIGSGLLDYSYIQVMCGSDCDHVGWGLKLC